MYYCLAGFSAMVNIKEKARNRLTRSHDFRYASVVTKSRILRLVKRSSINLNDEKRYF
jgi:hypothetical protein